MIRLPENRGITRTAGIKSLTTHLDQMVGPPKIEVPPVRNVGHFYFPSIT